MFDLIEQDILRYMHFSSDFSGDKVSFMRKLGAFLTPSVMCVAIYRVAHACHVRNWQWLASFFNGLNRLLHHCYISPGARIGPGLYIPHCSGIYFYGHAGKNLMLYARAVVGANEAVFSSNTVRDDAPIIGDDVMVGAFAVVSGPVSIGDNCKIGANVLLQTDTEADMTVFDRGKGVNIYKAEAS